MAPTIPGDPSIRLPMLPAQISRGILALAVAFGVEVVGVPVVVLAVGALASGVVAWQVVATTRVAVPRPEAS